MSVLSSLDTNSAIPFADIPDRDLTVEQIREKYKPNVIGPTWQRNPDGTWFLPEKTLGWEIAGWCAKWLLSLDENAPEGARFEFTLEQLRYVLWWYALDDRGQFLYKDSVLQRMKGWGKDPLLAVLAIVELVGPARFSHWDESGLPVGKRVHMAHVQVAAVSQAQTENTMDMIPALMSEQLIKEYGIEPGKELIRAAGGHKLLGITSNPRAIEGKRSTFAVLNETHHWVVGNSGHKMYEIVENNTTKMRGRAVAITNAYLPGEDSVAQKMREGYERKVELNERLAAEGYPTIKMDTLYDSLEAPSHTPLDPNILATIIEMVRGDAVWLDPEAIIASIMKPGVSHERSRRMWLNMVWADKDALYSPADWDPLESTGRLEQGDRVVLGFDGGKTDDATVLVAIRVSDLLAQVLHIQEKSPDDPDDWAVNRLAVDSAVHQAHRMFEVAGFYADVALWESHILEWSRLYGDEYAVKSSANDPIAWDMRASLKKVTMAHEQLMSAIFQKTIRHTGDKTLRRHVLNVFRRENNFGVSFGKESRESRKKVDLYAAMLLAYTCLRDLAMRGAEPPKKAGRGWFM